MLHNFFSFTNMTRIDTRSAAHMSDQDEPSMEATFHKDDADDRDSLELEDPIASLVYHDESGGDDIEVPIYAGIELCIGRLDCEKCSFFIADSRVSKRHFRIYSIIYDKEKYDEFQPLIYCEDLESTNGTYVNDICIGMIGSERVGHLLSDGDVVEIKPSWRFRFHQPSNHSSSQELGEREDLQYFADRYAVSDRILGKGQYGAVCLATEVATPTPKQLACKIIDIQQAMESMAENSSVITAKVWHRKEDRVKEVLKLVLRENKILSKLSHPNIIDLKKTFCSNTHIYIFTELAPGGDLFSYIDSKNGTLSDLQSRVISRQIVLAIQYMHRQGVAHRDIKPENVLIMQTDFGGRVVLTDFGFANYIHQSGRLNSRLGTSGFIAPEIEDVDAKKTGYTAAADLWSLGVLTACLLTGFSVIPREEFTQISQKEIADRFLGPHDELSRERWQSISPRPLDFLRGLLSINPEKRLTADQALKHSWFTKPATEAKLLEEGYQRVTRFWRKRDEDEEVIENLPGFGRTDISYNTNAPRPKFQKKLPDASSSPYFGLDRHLNQRLVSKRKNILKEVNNSGARFLTSDIYRKAVGVNTTSRRDKPLPTKLVDGKDIFGTSQNDTQDSGEFDLDEVSFIPTTPIPRAEKVYGCSDSVIPDSSQAQPTIQLEQQSSLKRVRVESENEEEKAMRDDVAKTIPKYSSAKVLKDEVMKKRLEKEMTRLRARHSSMNAA